MVSPVVSYPPGGRSPAHHHTPPAFIYAYVLSGAIRSQVDDQRGDDCCRHRDNAAHFFSAIHEFTADLRFWKSESNSAPADAENTE